MTLRLPHRARMLGYHDRLAGDVHMPPAHWSFAECAAYADGVAAAERRLAETPQAAALTAPKRASDRR